MVHAVNLFNINHKLEPEHWILCCFQTWMNETVSDCADDVIDVIGEEDWSECDVTNDVIV